MDMQYYLVLFDLDGTLIDTLADLAEAVNHALGLRGYPLHGVEEYRRMVGHGVRNLVQRALEELKTTLTKTIERRHYAFLADIAGGNRERIEDRALLLEMLQAGTVLEYNGKRWHDVHPLVVDFLKEQGEIERGE